MEGLRPDAAHDDAVDNLVTTLHAAVPPRSTASDDIAIGHVVDLLLETHKLASGGDRHVVGDRVVVVHDALP